MSVITVRVSLDERRLLEQRAKAEGVSLSALVRKALALRDEADALSGQVEDHERRIGRLEGMAGLA